MMPFALRIIRSLASFITDRQLTLTLIEKNSLVLLLTMSSTAGKVAATISMLHLIGLLH